MGAVIRGLIRLAFIPFTIVIMLGTFLFMLFMVPIILLFGKRTIDAEGKIVYRL